MKKPAALVLALLLLLTASGCMEKEYYYETSAITGADAQFEDSVDIRNYSMLKTALINLIARHAEHGQVRFVDYSGSPSEDLSAVSLEIRSNTPLGAYAVDKLSFNVSYVVSYYVADLTISYLRTVEEVQSIVYAVSQEELCTSVRTALEELSPRLVIRLYSSAVNEEFIRDLVKQYYYNDPIFIPTEPEVTVKGYPAEGANRLYDISLHYGATSSASAEMTLEMQNLLETEAARLTDATPARTALSAAAWLNGLKPGNTGAAANGSTAYGALLNGSKDSKALALAYKALCSAAGVDCMVVEGSKGSLGTEPHYWNIIELDGAYYHVDVSAFGRSPSLAFLRRDSDIWGEYIWSAADYPACEGTLSFAAVVGISALPDASPAPDSVPAEE